MEKEYVMQVAQIIKEQLVALTPMTVLMSWSRICRHSIQGFAGTPNQGKRTTARGICHRRAQWFGLLRGLSCEGNGRGMCEQRGLFR